MPLKSNSESIVSEKSLVTDLLKILGSPSAVVRVLTPDIPIVDLTSPNTRQGWVQSRGLFSYQILNILEKKYVWKVVTSGAVCTTVVYFYGTDWVDVIVAAVRKS